MDRKNLPKIGSRCHVLFNNLKYYAFGQFIASSKVVLLGVYD